MRIRNFSLGEYNYCELIGRKAAEVFTFIVKANDRIDVVFIHEFKQPPLLQDRISLSWMEEQLIKDALELRRSCELPFWDAVLLSCFRRPTVPERLLDAAMYHQDYSQSKIGVSRDDVINGRLEKASERNGEIGNAMLSEVILVDGSVGHIPMLDFHCRADEDNLKLVVAVTKRVFCGGGIVLESGESYHGIGLGVLSPEEFMSFLAKSFLFCPIVDRAYLAHQLADRRCSLRISKGGPSQKLPSVVAVVQ